MDLGMVGLGRMGANMTRRLLAAGHRVVAHDRSAAAVDALAAEGANAARTAAELAAALPSPRVVWLMVPAAVVDAAIDELAPHLAPGDVIVDGGNSFFQDDLRRAKALAARGLHHVDVGVSGGVHGLTRGYCLMVGGEAEVVARLRPVFEALSPGVNAAPRTPGRGGAPSPEEAGWLHCGPAGAGHFVKMVHNGIEYALMAAYAEGLNLLEHANAGAADRPSDAETAPLAHPEAYRYAFDLPAIAELWRRGSVVGSFLLDLTATALAESPSLEGFAGRVSDSGEGRWTVNAAVDVGAPVPVLSAALFDRFSSRGEGDFARKVLSAMRRQFGGHHETKA